MHFHAFSVPYSKKTAGVKTPDFSCCFSVGGFFPTNTARLLSSSAYWQTTQPQIIEMATARSLALAWAFQLKNHPEFTPGCLNRNCNRKAPSGRRRDARSKSKSFQQENA
jgi:hypothetical protein